MTKLDRSSNVPVYIQLKDLLIDKIESGELNPGDFIMTEDELCHEYGISKFPVRQALGELVKMGYLQRTRGKGTVINTELPDQRIDKKPILGLLLTSLSQSFCSDILSGFEKTAREKGYALIAGCSEGMPEEELKCIDMFINCNVRGMVLFPCEKSKVESRMESLKKNSIYLGFLDRTLSINEYDYTGSDNYGGAYTAVKHIAMQGYRSIVFISDKSNVSSIRERMEGYMKAVEDLEMNPLTNISVDGDLTTYFQYKHRFFIETFKEQFTALYENLPVGIFAVNDGVALHCTKVLKSENLMIGKDVGIVGFDNIPQGEFSNPPLTTIAQNGYLIGQTAANTAIAKIEGETTEVFRSILPTQLVVRKSCGEGI